MRFRGALRTSEIKVLLFLFIQKFHRKVCLIIVCKFIATSEKGRECKIV